MTETRKNGRNVNPVSEHCLRSLQPERAMDRVDSSWLRTSADERVAQVVWAARCRHGVMGCCGFWLFSIDFSFFRGQPHGASSCVFAYWALLHRCPPSNLSTTTQGAIVKLRGASLELCTLNLDQCWDSALARGPQAVLEFFGNRGGGLRGIGVSGSGYNEEPALVVLNVVDCVERRRRAEPPASASAPHAVAAAPSFQACLRGAMCTCCGVGGNCTRQVFCLPVQTSIYTGTGVLDTMVYTCDHTHHGVYICTRICAFCFFCTVQFS